MLVRHPGQPLMRYALLALVFGLIGGVGGALAIPRLFPQAAAPAGEGIQASRSDPVLLARIADLEATIERLDGGVRLEGRAPPRAMELAEDAVIPEPVVERLEARLVERLEPRMNEAVEAKFEELKAEGDGEPPARKERPRMDLQEVAREVGLSAREEDDLRRVYENANQRMLEIFAKPDGDVEQVKRDFEAFKEDEAARPKLMTKYIPKLMGNIGEIMAIEGEKQTGIQEAVGGEKAAKLEDYDIVEENPFGFGGGGSFNVSARAGGR